MEPVLFALGAATAFGGTVARSKLASFAAQRPTDYAVAQGERLDLRAHLNGPMICDGVIFGPLGRVSSRFTADFNAEWTGSHGVMQEHFRYDSGATQSREWRLALGNDGQVTATAADVIGEGRGKQSGNALHLRDRLQRPADAGGHVLDVNDWMYLVPGGTLVNRSQFRKFGLKVAELVATIRQGTR